MKILTRAAAIAAVGISLFFTLSLMGQQPRKVDDAALKSAGKSGDEWLTYGLTPGETRYSPLKQIDTTNVSRVGLSMELRDFLRRRRQPGSNAAVLERHDLQPHQLEHRIRCRRAHRQREVALGSGSESG